MKSLKGVSLTCLQKFLCQHIHGCPQTNERFRILTCLHVASFFRMQHKSFSVYNTLEQKKPSNNFIAFSNHLIIPHSHFQDMVYVRKNLPDHEATVLLQSNLPAKMNDPIVLNNEGEAQQQTNQLQNVNGSIVKQKPRALLLCQPNSHPFQVIL